MKNYKIRTRYVMWFGQSDLRPWVNERERERGLY